MIWCYLLLVILITYNGISMANKHEICSAEDAADWNLAELTFKNSEPNGLAPNVKILHKSIVNSENECFKTCCNKRRCDAISFNRNLCIQYHCNPKSACKPKKMSEFGISSVYIVLQTYSNETKELPRHQRKDFDENSPACDIGLPDNCPENTMCKRTHQESRSGICVCFAGFVKGPDGCSEETKVEHKEDEINLVTKAKNIDKNKGKEHNAEEVFTTTMITTLDNTSVQSTKSVPPLTTVKSVTKEAVHQIFAHAGPELHIHVANPHKSSHPEILTIFGWATNKDGVVLYKDVTYEWKRDVSSLSIGEVINGSDHKATLMLMNLVQGQYKFLLTVTDKSGDRSSDSVKLFVTEKQDERFEHLVEVLFETNVYKFTEQESVNFARRMVHVIEKNLLYTDCQVHVTAVSGDRKNRTRISFYAEAIDPNTKESQMLSAGLLEEKLKKKLTQNKFIFDYTIKRFQSKVCYNNCGGHGQCCMHTHRCKCSLPWMNNPWHEQSTGFSNCDMHVMIIVVIAAVALFTAVLLILALKKIFKICRRKRKFGRDLLRYKLLDNADS